MFEERHSLGAVLAGAHLLHDMILAAKNKNYVLLESHHQECTNLSIKTSKYPAGKNYISNYKFVEKLQELLPHSRFAASFKLEMNKAFDMKTICIQRVSKLKVSVLLGVHAGYLQQTCETGLGRRFSRRGPLVGGSWNALGFGFFKKKSLCELASDDDGGTLFEEWKSDFAVGLGANLDGLTVDRDVKVRGFGGHLSNVEGSKVFSSTKMRKPNFLPLFEKFGLEIPEPKPLGVQHETAWVTPEYSPRESNEHGAN
jgi:hypothetical protein